MTFLKNFFWMKNSIMASVQPTKRVIFHLGYHKTGSTSIQFWLRDNLPEISEQIALYSVIGDSANSLKVPANLLSMGLIGPKVFAERARDWADTCRALPQDTVIITDESLPGLPLGVRQQGYHETRIYPAAAQVVGLLAAAFREFDPLFVVFERAPEPWLKSIHNEMVKQGRILEDFDDYLARYTPDVQWGDLRQGMEQAIADATNGRGQLISYSFEEEFAKPLVADMKFFELLDLPPEVMARCTPTLGVANKSLSPEELQRLREAKAQAADAAAPPPEDQRQLTAAEIDLAFRLFLNRAPSGDEVARIQAQGAGLSSIRRMFLHSQEFSLLARGILPQTL